MLPISSLHFLPLIRRFLHLRSPLRPPPSSFVLFLHLSTWCDNAVTEEQLPFTTGAIEIGRSKI